MEEAKSEPTDDRSNAPTPATDPSLQGSKLASLTPNPTGSEPARETQTARDVNDQQNPTVPDSPDYQAIIREQSKLIHEQGKLIESLTASVNTLFQKIKTLENSVEYLKFQQKTFADHGSAGSPIGVTEDLVILHGKVDGLNSKINEQDGLEERILRNSKDISALVHAYVNGKPLLDEDGNDLEPQDLSNLDIDATLARARPRKGCEDLVDLLVQAKELKLEKYEGGISSGDDEDGLVDSHEDSTMQPRITSAEKVAAQKRRRQQSDLSSSSSTSAPVHKKRASLPKVTGKLDGSTKPRSSSSTHKGKLTSLNDYTTVMVSDPDDSDYDPNSQPANPDLADAKGTHARLRTGKKALVRFPTPEWEQPDWEHPSTVAQTMRGTSSVRRGTSGRHPIADRQKMRQSSYTPTLNSYENPSPYSPDPSQEELTEPKRRDAQGHLLRVNGKIDGRSLRHRKAKASMKQAGTPEQGGSSEKKGYHQRSSEAIKEVEEQGGGTGGTPWPLKYHIPGSGDSAMTPTPATGIGQSQGSSSSGRENQSGFVDAAALAKAGLGPKMGTFATTSKNGGNGGAAAAPGSSAQAAGAEEGADGKKWGEDHKKLMKNIFPHQKWR
ncbi:MAG: hypothetical protein Q9174_006031 [Haloplaca sp. 1 TL-2023]